MEKLKYIPNTIQIEFTQGCNRHCPFCGTRGIESTIHFMQFSTLERIIAEIKRVDWHSHILLAGHGEPTLNKDYIKFIKYIRDNLPKVRISLMTNGYSMQNNISEINTLFEVGLTNLIFDEYADNSLENIKTFLQIQGISYETNGQKGVKLFSDKPQILFNPPIELSKVSTNRNLTNHCGAGLPPVKEPKKARCTKVFRELYFRHDGNVSICCDDFRGEYFIGDINNMNIIDIWMHPRFESARRFLYAGLRVFHPCNICATSPVRPGLLPDRMGKETMPEPSQHDYDVVSYRTLPLANIVKRDWEYEHSN